MFKKLTRTKQRVAIAVVGRSGSGKTVGALRLARGLAGGDFSDVFYIQLDPKDAGVYIDDDRFPEFSELREVNAVPISPPYHPDRLSAAVEEAYRSGARVVVIDSLTEVYNGPGGLADLHQSAGGTFRDWNAASVNPPWQRLIDLITLRMPAHIVATMKAKTRYEVSAGENGKTRIESLGVGPIIRPDTEYRFSLLLQLDGDTHRAEALASHGRMIATETPVFELSAELGEGIREWADTGGESWVRVYGDGEAVDVLRVEERVVFDIMVERNGTAPRSRLEARAFFGRNRADCAARIESAILEESGFSGEEGSE